MIIEDITIEEFNTVAERVADESSRPLDSDKLVEILSKPLDKGDGE